MFYGLYDDQLGGFKAGYVSKTLDGIKDLAMERVFDIHEDFLEGERTWDEVLEEMTEEEVLDLIGYSIREVTPEQAEKIAMSEEYGLLTVVKM